MTGDHRAPRVRTRALAVALVIALSATAGLTYRTYWYEAAPDAAAAGSGYWVSTHGDDDWPGSARKPWRTVAHAVATAPAGAKIFLREGQYRPFTAARADQTITSAPGERATVVGRSGKRDVVLITAAGVTLSDVTVSGCVPNPTPDVDITGDHGSGIRIAKADDVTVQNVTVRDSHGVNSGGLAAGCYGILATDAHRALISGSEVYHNGAGIVVSGGGKGTVVEGNNVHDQDVIVQNTTAANDDFGGYGLAATFVTDSPGPTFRNNIVRSNYGPSHDYTRDGGGFELYDAHNTTITGNTFAANDGVLETGSGSSGTCSGNVFSNNSATTDQDPSDLDSDTGLVLRCAAGMVITGNTFTDLMMFTVLLSTGGDFAGSIEGLTITGNTVTRQGAAVIYRLQYATTTPALTIDKNTYATGQAKFAVIDATWSETPATFDAWKTRTGHDVSSTLATS